MKLIRKYQGSGKFTAVLDNTRMLPIQPKLTYEQAKAKNLIRLQRNPEAVIEPYDYEAHHGWMEINPNTEELTWHAPTVVENKLEGADMQLLRRMLDSPTMNLLLNIPFGGMSYMRNNLGSKIVLTVAKKPYSSPNITITSIPRKAYTTPKLEITSVNVGNDVVSTGGAYHIENFPGHHIKALMRHNPLEDLLSRNGTIAVSNIRLYMNNRSRMEQDIVALVLALPLFKGLSKIDYNSFRKAVQDMLLVPGSSLQREYSYGTEFPLVRFNVGFNKSDPVLHISDFSLIDPNVPTIADGFISSMTEKRLALRNSEIEQLILDLIAQAPEENVSSLLFGFTKDPKYKGISLKVFNLVQELLKNSKLIEDIRKTKGGTKYFLVKHLKDDYTTKLIQLTLQRAALLTRSKVEYPNTPDVIKRLKTMKLNYIIEGDKVIVDVPKNFSLQEIVFKTGGTFKNIKK